MSKKRIAAILAAAMMVSQTGVFALETKMEIVSGGEEIVQPCFVALIDCELDFSISSGTAHCLAETNVRSGYKAKTIVELQKKGLSWNTTKTWTKTGINTTAIVDEDYAVTSGTYRIKVTHQALSGTTVVEEEVTYSNEITK